MKTKTNFRDRDEIFPFTPFYLLFTSLLLPLGWKRDWEEEDVQRSFFAFRFLRGLPPFWTRISLDNSLLFFWAIRAILFILLIASFAMYILEINLCQFLTSAQWGCQNLKEKDGELCSTFILLWCWENTTFDWNRDLIKKGFKSKESFWTW